MISNPNWINEMSTLDMVREFHNAFGVHCATHPTIDNVTVNALRLSLLEEEVGELWQALNAGDKVATLDALTDIQYVLDGAYLALGFSHVKQEAFKEVHRSNMSKLGDDGHPVRRPDGKVLKGPHYTPPDLSTLVL